MARRTQRNGTSAKLVAIATGDITVKIPKLRAGSYFRSLPEPRRRIDIALQAVSMQAWLEGVSTRKVDDLVAVPGIESGISKSEASRICGQLDGDVAAWCGRELGAQAKPYVFLEATCCEARVNGRVVSRAVVIATGVTVDGRPEVPGRDVGDSETEDFWTEFLRSLRERGLHGVQLVISDAHRGLVASIGAVCAGAAWQRSRVHFMRNALAKVANGQREMVAAATRTIFIQPTGPGVREHVDIVADRFSPSCCTKRKPTSPRSLTSLKPTGTKSGPQIPFERLNKEVKRRTDVVGIFPDDDSLLRLSACADRGPRRMAGQRPPLPL